MKEDKENTRPKERKVEIKCEENEKTEKPNKEKKEAMTKVASLFTATRRAVSFLAYDRNLYSRVKLHNSQQRRGFLLY